MPDLRAENSRQGLLHFAQADARKIGDNLYRARLNRSDRLLFSLYQHGGESYCLILEYIRNHAFDKSRFLERGVVIDEDKIPAVNSITGETLPALTYVNTTHKHFNPVDKTITANVAAGHCKGSVWTFGRFRPLPRRP